MKVLPGLVLILLLLVSGCRPAPTLLPASSPAPEEFSSGEPVNFSVKATFPQFCTGQATFSIQQVLAEGSRPVQLEHSCLGIVGSGVDETCENGQVVRVSVGTCSDALSCIENYTVEAEFTWDQQEYVPVTGQCAGTAIRREAKQPAPPGTYQVVVNGQVIKEFTIRPAAP